jgi:predicted AlkP superfamily phosphohydrolase/phosphomutase
MLWSYADDAHPGHREDDMLMNGIKMAYEEFDDVVGQVQASIDDDATLIIMSDHGFCPFYWGVNLNTWLKEKGYVTLRDPNVSGEYLSNVDWSKTKAYALGLNGLYVNLKGREFRGIVKESEYQALLDQIEKDLLEMVDPRNGQKAVTLVVQPRRDFHGEYADDGPDIIVGYNWAYRSSWESPSGKFPKEVFVDNDEAWSGDHSVDYRHVPGVLISNREITMENPALYDLTVAILDEYGIAKPDEMIGQDCLGEPVTASNDAPSGAAHTDAAVDAAD